MIIHKSYTVDTHNFSTVFKAKSNGNKKKWGKNNNFDNDIQLFFLQERKEDW